MADLIIRKATDNDLDVLRIFEQGVIAAERPFDPTLKTEATNYYDFDVLLSSPQSHLVVAEINGEVVGSGYARLEQSKHFLKHRQHAYLGFMFVKPEYRGKGINRAIVQALEKWSAEQGVTELRLEVYFQNAPAIRAYEKVGFASLLIEMRKGLGE